MGIYAEKPEGGDFKSVEPGTYVARCYSMIEIGTVKVVYKGTEKMQKKVSITWELPTELAVFKEGKSPEPYVVSKKYTLSMYKDSNLRKDLEAWRGKGYTDEEAAKVDITKLIGQPCLVSVVQSPRPDDPSKTYTAVTQVAKLMRGQDCAPQINPTRVLSYDKFDWEVFDKLSDYMKDQIRSSDEFKKMQEPSQINEHDIPPDSQNEDDLPF
jgi:hypothetical protein